jgi:peptidyl-prolyl cis-trans isomerase D
MMNSDVPFDGSFHKKGSLAPNIDSIMFSAPIGTTVGPYSANGSFQIAKLTAISMIPDSVKARHILLKLDNPANKDKVMATADSIKKAIQGGADFAMMSSKYSTDEGAKAKGGDLGWFSSGMMVKEYNDACFEGKKGDMPIVQTQFGIHIIQIEDQGKSSRQVKVAMITRKVEASSKTYQTIYSKANEFAAKSSSAEAFDNAVKESKLNKLTESNIVENAKQVGPIENSRELVRWAFKSKVGEISKAFEFGNRFAVAKLTDAREKGFSTLEQVKDQVTAEARRDKKAEMLIEKLKKGTTVDAIASSVGQTVMTADNISFAAPNLGPAGMEGNVVGHIMTMKSGQTSAPLKGQNGVYVVNIASQTEPQAPTAVDLKGDAARALQGVQQRSQYEVFNALREKADITDSRAKFY